MSKWWKILPWKFGKGSISPPMPCEIQHWCRNIVKAVPVLWKSDCFLVFYCLCHSWEMSMWNLFTESICFGGLMGLLSSFHLKMLLFVYSLFQFAAFRSWTAFSLHVMLLLAYVSFVPLHSLTATSHFEWQGNQSALTYLSFLSNPWSECVVMLLPIPMYTRMLRTGLQGVLCIFPLMQLPPQEKAMGSYKIFLCSVTWPHMERVKWD